MYKCTLKKMWVISIAISLSLELERVSRESRERERERDRLVQYILQCCGRYIECIEYIYYECRYHSSHKYFVTWTFEMFGIFFVEGEYLSSYASIFNLCIDHPNKMIFGSSSKMQN